MQDFSMHILDIAQNSVRAEAKDIAITVIEDTDKNLLSFSIEDNGCGMSPEMLKAVRDPFTTSRTTRKVGLGIPMLEQTCQQCNGYLEIESVVGKGTKLKAVMEHNHIDRPPMGDLAETVFLLIVSNTGHDFMYRHVYNNREYFLDTREVKEVLEDLPLTDPSVMEWLKANIQEGLTEITDVGDEE